MIFKNMMMNRDVVLFKLTTKVKKLKSKWTLSPLKNRRQRTFWLYPEML